MIGDPTPAIRLGTRGSALALAQAQQVVSALARLHVDCTVEVITTAGDLRAPDTAWGEGAFVGELERALLDGRIEMAVHSAKDVPIEQDARLAIAAYLERADPRDALVVDPAVAGATLDTLPAQSRLGTDSPRRTGFVRARRPGVDVRPLHGNVDTRLRRLAEGSVDGLILAAAGLDRLGRADRISQRIPVEQVPPAPGQGALCIQVRARDDGLRRLGAELDHRPTRQAVEAERAFLAAAGGGCRAPLGAVAVVDRDFIRITAGYAELDGSAAAVETVEGPADVAAALAADLAARILRRRGRAMAGARVIVTRPAASAVGLARRLAELGLQPLVVPAIEIEPAPPGGRLDEVLPRLAEYEWTVVTSANGVAAVAAAAERLRLPLAPTRWAAVGAATARALARAGAGEAWQPSRADGAALATELPVTPRAPVLLLRGDLSDDALPVRLRERGALVDEVVAYGTVEAPARSAPLLDAALGGPPIAAVIYASPSQVRGLLELAGRRLRAKVIALPAVCIGATTAAAARAAGLTVLGEAPMGSAIALAELAAELLARRGEGAGR